MQKLLDIMAQLRDPETGCPWDKKQTLQSIFPHTLEEVYEVGGAIDNGDLTELKDELGDLLFQIVFYTQITKEQGDFTFDDVVDTISEKMTRRHPHIFGDVVYANEAEQKAAWNAIKHKEKEQKNQLNSEDFFSDITKTLTSLQRGQKVLNKAATIGFDWDNWEPVIAKVREELEEIEEAVEQGESQQRIEEEVGDLYIAATNLARHLKVDAENATRKSSSKFEKRFNRMREITAELYPDEVEPTLEQMDHAWEVVKQEERKPSQAT